MGQLTGLDQMHHRPQDDMWSDRRAVITTPASPEPRSGAETPRYSTKPSMIGATAGSENRPGCNRRS